MCETDSSGYPDCRDDTIKAQQVALGLGLGTRVTIETPLMWIDKADTWELARQLGGQPLVDLVVAHRHTRYLDELGPRAAWGSGYGARQIGRASWRGGVGREV